MKWPLLPSSQATRVSLFTAVPVYTARTLSKLEPPVSIEYSPESSGVYLNHTL